MEECYFIHLFTNLFNVDNLQILRYCKKLENSIAHHIANLRQRLKSTCQKSKVHYTYKHTNYN